MLPCHPWTSFVVSPNHLGDRAPEHPDWLGLIVTGSTPDALNSISRTAQVAQLVTPHALRESPHSLPLPLFLPLPGQFKQKKKRKEKKNDLFLWYCIKMTYVSLCKMR